MTRPADFTRTTKLAAWKRAGGPDDPRCECGCGLPISRSDPAEFHHIEEAESGASAERIAYLRSLANCACVRKSCHARITARETAPKIAKSRRVRAAHAGATRPKRLIPGSKGSGFRRPMSGKTIRVDE